MAKVYTTGPAHLYIRCTCDPGPPIYLGTAESAPDIDITYEYDPVMNDLGGQRLPFDRIYGGAEARISAILTRYNESTVAYLEDIPGLLPASERGFNFIEEIGTLMGSEGATFVTWLQFPYAAKAAFADMPPGYRFWSCVYLPDRIMPGTRAKRHHVMFQATRAFTFGQSPFDGPAVQNGPGVEGAIFVLYDHEMGELPNLPNIGAAPD